MNFKNLLVILSMGMVFSALCATTPENVDKEKTITETQPPFTIKSLDPPVPTPVDDMKEVDVECMAYIFSMTDENGATIYWAFDTMEEGNEAGWKLEGHYFDNQVGCVISEGSICYATRCSHNLNNGM